MTEVVVLCGAPGSGKSTVGYELHQRGLRWRDWEPLVLQRWGSRANFISHKATALPQLHADMLDWIDSDGPIAVIETTGLSDAPLLDLLARDRDAFLVRLDASEREAMRRVAERHQDRHLTDDIEANRAIWRAFYEHVVPYRQPDLVIDTEAVLPPATAVEIVKRLGL